MHLADFFRQVEKWIRIQISEESVLGEMLLLASDAIVASQAKLRSNSIRNGKKEINVHRHRASLWQYREGHSCSRRWTKSKQLHGFNGPSSFLNTLQESVISLLSRAKVRASVALPSKRWSMQFCSAKTSSLFKGFILSPLHSVGNLRAVSTGCASVPASANF